VPWRTYSLSSFPVVARLGGDRVADLPQELVGLLVHAHHRSAGIAGSGVDGQHVFHPGGELSAIMKFPRLEGLAIT
jgi:hypothetical protein